MNWNKVKNVALITFGLLSAFAGVVYQGQLAGNEVGPGMTFGVLAGLVLVMWGRYQAVFGKADVGTLSAVSKAFHVASAVASVVVPVVVIFHGKFAAGSTAFIVSGYVSTFLGDLAKTAGVLPASSSSTDQATGGPVAVLLVAASLLAAPSARAAEPTPNDVAPPLSFCVGDTYHCMMPDFNFSMVRYDLVAKKWDSIGITSVGVGYEFMFYSNQPWSFGPALHVAGQWGQDKPSYFGLTPTLVFFKYVELGASFDLRDGAVDKYLVAGLSGNTELLTRWITGKGIEVRLGEARREYAAKLAAGAQQP